MDTDTTQHGHGQEQGKGHDIQEKDTTFRDRDTSGQRHKWTGTVTLMGKQRGRDTEGQEEGEGHYRQREGQGHKRERDTTDREGQGHRRQGQVPELRRTGTGTKADRDRDQCRQGQE
jgi:hypothetical protein